MTLASVGCGEGQRNPTDEEAEAIAMLVDADLGLEEQRCILQSLLDNEISAQMILEGTLTADQDGILLAAAVECVDDLARVDAFVESFIEGAAEGGTVLSREEAECAIRALGEDDVDAAVVECLGARAGDAGDYGDDPVLDLLWDQCEGGNPQACDELFRDAPVGSAYEDFGRTCGGTLPESRGLECFEMSG